MKSNKRKATNFPVRWQANAELTAAACGREGYIIDSSLLGGGRSSGIVERNLLSQFEGAAEVQVPNDRPEPSLALSLRLGSQEEPERQPQPQNRLPSAPTRPNPSLLPVRGSSVPPHTYAPGSSPAGAGAGAGLAPPQLGSNSSLQLSLGVAATPPQSGYGACIYDTLAADLLKRLSEELDRKVGLLRQELSAEVRKEVLRLHAAAAAAAAGVPLPAAAFSAAGLPQQHPCGGGAWRSCPACGARPGTVALKPYEHLCVCTQCSADASRLCPLCSSFTWTGALVNAASGGRGRGRGRAREASLPPLPWP